MSFSAAAALEVCAAAAALEACAAAAVLEVCAATAALELEVCTLIRSLDAYVTHGRRISPMTSLLRRGNCVIDEAPFDDFAANEPSSCTTTSPSPGAISLGSPG